jgi:hypothetical protein
VQKHEDASCADFSAEEAAVHEALAAWIEYAIEPAQEVGVDSYRLRQEFEAAAFPVRNVTIKAAMDRAGYEPIDPEALCWRFKARHRLPRRETTWFTFVGKDGERWRTFQRALDEVFKLRLP